jgi:hypothetical protein
MQLASIIANRVDTAVEPPARLVLLCRMAGVNYSEIERACGLGRGVISSYVGGRAYAYPRLKEAVADYLAIALGADGMDVYEYLFPDNGPAP